jgi:histidyl-tRNA synthetase
VLTKAPRGTKDILPAEAERWKYLEKQAAEVCRLFGYAEIRTPVFEHTELFLRGVGEVTDIVAKEMYTFKDRGGRSVTLRPEGTAPVVRAFLEHGLAAEAQPLKVYYLGPMFRYDRPQAGRYRQFHQFGVEVFGSGDPTVDAEVMVLALTFLRRLGLTGFSLHINSVGCPACREAARNCLREHLAASLGQFCPDCVERYDKNPLRIMDCKLERCRELTEGAPVMLDNLCPPCAEHFREVREALTALGEQYVVDSRLVRGLDYYTRTAFEIVSADLSSQSICGGGRYDHLLKQIGGPDLPGIGFAVGMERTLLAMEAAGIAPPAAGKPEVFVATAGSVPGREALKTVMELRLSGLSADKDYLGRGLRAQLKAADRKGAKLLVILGDEELSRGQAVVRDMQSGRQETVPRAELTERLARLLREC